MKTNSYYIRADELSESLGVSKSTLWRWRKDGVIPEPINLGPRLIAWNRQEIYNSFESK